MKARNETYTGLEYHRTILEPILPEKNHFSVYSSSSFLISVKMTTHLSDLFDPTCKLQQPGFLKMPQKGESCRLSPHRLLGVSL